MSARIATRSVIGAVALVASFALAGCASQTPATQAASVTLQNGWAKAVPSMQNGGMGMSAIFGTLANSSSASANLVSASCPAVAGTIQLHETFTDSTGTSSMRQKAGGFVVPAKGSFVLEPGGYHIMLMDMPAATALVSGDSISCTLTFADASTENITVPVKDSATYSESTGTATSMSGMNMGG